MEGIKGLTAHVIQAKDTVIQVRTQSFLITYASMSTESTRACNPRIVYVDHDRILQLWQGPRRRHYALVIRPPFALNSKVN